MPPRRALAFKRSARIARGAPQTGRLCAVRLHLSSPNGAREGSRRVKTPTGKYVAHDWGSLCKSDRMLVRSSNAAEAPGAPSHAAARFADPLRPCPSPLSKFAISPHPPPYRLAVWHGYSIACTAKIDPSLAARKDGRMDCRCMLVSLQPRNLIPSYIIPPGLFEAWISYPVQALDPLELS